MGKVDSTLSALEKLYSKRNALDKQIVASEKKLVAEVKGASKVAGPAKKPAKTRAKKPAAKKPAAPTKLIKK